MTNTSETLKSHLDRLGLTVGRFAELIGVNRNTVGRWLSGERGIPKVVLLYLELLGPKPKQVNERVAPRTQTAPSTPASPTIDPSWALAEGFLTIDAVVQSVSALFQQLLWLLLSKGVFEKAELMAAIDVCIASSRRESALRSAAAVAYLSDIRATIDAGDPDQRTH
jgi:transcriptional regulator with XRE-family HTH domain